MLVLTGIFSDCVVGNDVYWFLGYVYSYAVFILSVCIILILYELAR